MADASVEIGKHKIEIHCPHVEGGSCTDCMAPQIVPYVAARTTLDALLPKFAMLTDALHRLSSQAETLAKGTDKLRDWAEELAKAKWELGPAADPGNSTEGEG